MNVNCPKGYRRVRDVVVPCVVPVRTRSRWTDKLRRKAPWSVRSSAQSHRRRWWWRGRRWYPCARWLGRSSPSDQRRTPPSWHCTASSLDVWTTVASHLQAKPESFDVYRRRNGKHGITWWLHAVGFAMIIFFNRPNLKSKPTRLASLTYTQKQKFRRHKYCIYYVA